jgi:MSHA biogenesis protein MshO
MRCPSVRRPRGVTLVEMVIVIAISAIIAGAVAVFIARPIEGYADATRRAELTDIADSALRRMTRDLRTALPNSIRITPLAQPPGTTVYLEFLQTSGGGRYRAQVDSGGAGIPLRFDAAVSTFDVIGAMPPLAANNLIVIYNLNSSGAVANAYSGDNRATYSSSAGATITLTAAKQFPFASPGNRFQVVEYPVTYECNPTSGQLRRYWNYAIVDTPQPTPPATANNVLLATEVSACTFTYANTGTSGTFTRTGVVTLDLTVQRAGELIRLFQQVHVSNAP